MMDVGRLLEKRYLPVLLILGILLSLPYWSGPVWLRIIIYTLWMAYICASWNIVGISGLFSLMHAVFLGLGGYVSTLLWMNLGLSPWLGMLAGGLSSALMGVAVCYFCFRANLPVLGFGIFTLALSVMAVFVVATVPIAGYTEGVMLVYRGTDPSNFQFESTIPFYYIILAFLAIVVFVTWRIMNSKIGLYFRAVRDNDVVARAAGVNVLGVRLLAMGMSGFFTALGGSFWAQYYRFLGPEMVGPHLIFTVILLTVLGGMGTLWGPVVGPFLLIPLAEYLRQTITAAPGIHLMIYGGAVAVILLTLRMGVVQWVAIKYQQRQRLRQTMTAGGGSGGS